MMGCCSVADHLRLLRAFKLDLNLLLCKRDGHLLAGAQVASSGPTLVGSGFSSDIPFNAVLCAAVF